MSSATRETAHGIFGEAHVYASHITEDLRAPL